MNGGDKKIRQESNQELKLRKYAKEKPVKLLQELKSKTYESKYIAALAFGKGVVRTNFGKTAIIWNNETEGVILTLARGESGISKLGELLSKRTDESEILLTAIGENLDKIAINLPKKAAAKETDKDAEIENLKAQLAGFKEAQKKTTQLSELQKRLSIPNCSRACVRSLFRAASFCPLLNLFNGAPRLPYNECYTN